MPDPLPPFDGPPRTTADQLADQEGEWVRLQGTYRLLDVRQAALGAPVYRGHALLVLADKTTIYLEAPWSKQALRPEAERALHGQPVEVWGLFHSTTPLPPEQQAMLVGPTLTGVVVKPSL